MITAEPLTAERDERITETVLRERRRLWEFIRRRVPDRGEAEDILQEVFFEYVQACRLLEPIEQAGAWLFRVARNRIIDRFRKKREIQLSDLSDEVDDELRLDEVLPAHEAGPEARYLRRVLVDALAAALAELPQEQREVFIAHELEGCSFRELAAQSGVNINTLLARKRYAVRHLRERLQAIHDELDI